MDPFLSLYLCGINILGFSLMGVDKRRARSNSARRIPERTLFFTALAGGSVGALVGMWTFRHKTKHWYFVWGMPAILLVQGVILMRYALV